MVADGDDVQESWGTEISIAELSPPGGVGQTVNEVGGVVASSMGESGYLRSYGMVLTGIGEKDVMRAKKGRRVV